MMRGGEQKVGHEVNMSLLNHPVYDYLTDYSARFSESMYQVFEDFGITKDQYIDVYKEVYSDINPYTVLAYAYLFMGRSNVIGRSSYVKGLRKNEIKKMLKQYENTEDDVEKVKLTLTLANKLIEYAKANGATGSQISAFKSAIVSTFLAFREFYNGLEGFSYNPVKYVNDINKKLKQTENPQLIDISRLKLDYDTLNNLRLADFVYTQYVYYISPLSVMFDYDENEKTYRLKDGFSLDDFEGLLDRLGLSSWWTGKHGFKRKIDKVVYEKDGYVYFRRQYFDTIANVINERLVFKDFMGYVSPDRLDLSMFLSDVSSDSVLGKNLPLPVLLGGLLSGAKMEKRYGRTKEERLSVKPIPKFENIIPDRWIKVNELKVIKPRLTGTYVTADHLPVVEPVEIHKTWWERIKDFFSSRFDINFTGGIVSSFDQQQYTQMDVQTQEEPITVNGGRLYLSNKLNYRMGVDDDFNEWLMDEINNRLPEGYELTDISVDDQNNLVLSFEVPEGESNFGVSTVTFTIPPGSSVNDYLDQFFNEAGPGNRLDLPLMLWYDVDNEPYFRFRYTSNEQPENPVMYNGFQLFFSDDENLSLVMNTNVGQVNITLNPVENQLDITPYLTISPEQYRNPYEFVGSILREFDWMVSSGVLKGYTLSAENLKIRIPNIRRSGEETYLTGKIRLVRDGDRKELEIIGDPGSGLPKVRYTYKYDQLGGSGVLWLGDEKVVEFNNLNHDDIGTLLTYNWRSVLPSLIDDDTRVVVHVGSLQKVLESMGVHLDLREIVRGDTLTLGKRDYEFLYRVLMNRKEFRDLSFEEKVNLILQNTSLGDQLNISGINSLLSNMTVRTADEIELLAKQGRSEINRPVVGTYGRVRMMYGMFNLEMGGSLGLYNTLGLNYPLDFWVSRVPVILGLGYGRFEAVIPIGRYGSARPSMVIKPFLEGYYGRGIPLGVMVRMDRAMDRILRGTDERIPIGKPSLSFSDTGVTIDLTKEVQVSPDKLGDTLPYGKGGVATKFFISPDNYLDFSCTISPTYTLNKRTDETGKKTMEKHPSTPSRYVLEERTDKTGEYYFKRGFVGRYDIGWTTRFTGSQLRLNLSFLDRGPDNTGQLFNLYSMGLSYETESGGWFGIDYSQLTKGGMIGIRPRLGRVLVGGGIYYTLTSGGVRVRSLQVDLTSPSIPITFSGGYNVRSRTWSAGLNIQF